MKKIPTMFQRNHETDRLVRDEVTPGCEWVLTGEGRATRKWDGTCCMVRDGKLYRRYDGHKSKVLPAAFIPAYAESDRVTDENATHWIGWLPVDDGPSNKYHREAFTGYEENWTYELCGPKVNGNPEGFGTHRLIGHGLYEYDNVPRTFDGLKEFFRTGEGRFIEGIVWYHPDGRMAKIKGRDFGFKRIKP